MKCAEFSEIVSDLARNEGLDEAARQSAFLHADACPRCDEELVMARTLSAALHALAASTTAASAPARVEEILRGQMRQRRAVAAMPAPRARRWAIGGIAGLAAVALISIALLKPEVFHPRGAGSSGQFLTRLAVRQVGAGIDDRIGRHEQRAAREGQHATRFCRAGIARTIFKVIRGQALARGERLSLNCPPLSDGARPANR